MVWHALEEEHFWKKAVAAAYVGVAGLSLAACTPTSEKPPATAPVTTETPPVSEPTPTPSETESNTPGSQEWLPAKGDYLSADKLAELNGDYDKIVEAFTMSGDDFSTFEEFAQLHNYIDTSYLRSGTSDTEINEFKNAPAQLKDYVTDTYAEAFAEASAFEGAVDKNLDNNHRIIATQYIVTRAYEDSGIQYVFGQDLVSVNETTGKVTDDTFSVTYTAQRHDNLADTVLGQNDAGQSMADKIEVTVTAHLMDDGNIKTQTHWGPAE